MGQTILNIYTESENFLSNLFEKFEQNNLIVQNHWDIDHICYRVSTQTEYENLKIELNKMGDLLVESPVNGRLISTYKLFKPIYFKQWKIDILELPAPKEGSAYLTGFEHIEIVCDIGFAEILKTYSHLISFSGFDKSFNKEIQINFDGAKVKFHHMSLESVIRIEKNELLYKALKNSKVFNILSEYDLELAGTFPLGIYTKNSDVDLIVGLKNLNLEILELETLLRFNFPEVKIEKEESINKGLRSVTFSFEFENVRFEIFCQEKLAVQQDAYQHFLVEEKILKYSPSELILNQIKALRAQGLKTEPAFAKVLGLQGDCYQELLTLQKYSIQDLQRLLT